MSFEALGEIKSRSKTVLSPSGPSALSSTTECSHTTSEAKATGQACGLAVNQGTGEEVSLPSLGT